MSGDGSIPPLFIPKGGLPIDRMVSICRNCDRMAEQFWKFPPGADISQIACGMPCCGPSHGMFYPLYSGPLTRIQIAEQCVICGISKDEAVKLGHRIRTISADGEMVLGFCSDHVCMKAIGIDPSITDPPDKIVL